jgi:hypothetical protein
MFGRQRGLISKCEIAELLLSLLYEIQYSTFPK